MPRLTNCDKLEVLSRNPQFMADVEKLNAPFELTRALSSEARKESAQLRARIKRVWWHSDLSPGGIRNMLDQLKRSAIRDDALTLAVSAIPCKLKSAKGTVLRYLRSGRFLHLKIDVTAATKEELVEAVGEYITAFQPKHMKGRRKRKRHKATSYLDPWTIYDRWKGGETVYAIARETYRKNRVNVAGFDASTREYKAVNRALKAAQAMIRRCPYPPQ